MEALPVFHIQSMSWAYVNPILGVAFPGDYVDEALRDAHTEQAQDLERTVDHQDKDDCCEKDEAANRP